MTERWAHDAIILLDGENPPFRAYIMQEEVDRINNCGGLGSADRVNIRETIDRPVPDSLKNGLSEITDVWITMVCGKEYKP